MIEKVVKSINLKNDSSSKDDVAYWLSKTPEERLDLVEQLRLESGKFLYEYPARLRRTVTVVRKT